MQNLKAITLDLDDTLWPSGPALAEAEAQLHQWLEGNAPAVAVALPLAGVGGVAAPVRAVVLTPTATSLNLPDLNPKPVGRTTDLVAAITPAIGSGTVIFYDTTGGGRVEIGSAPAGADPYVFGQSRATLTIPADMAAGSYELLAAFQGKSANGTWQLQGTDWYNGEIGNINRFSLIVTPYACVNVARTVAMTATKTVAGSFTPAGTVTYTVTLTNTGNGVQADNSGDEYVDVLPSRLTLVPASTTATRGTLTTGGNTVHWNGSLEAGASVVLTIVATVKPNTGSLVVSSQGTVSYDANHDGTNEATLPTDDPGVAGSANPTVFTVAGPPTNLDIDGNGTYDPLTDGLLILRYLSGMTGNALIGGAITPGAPRNNATLVQNYLATLGTVLDIDGNSHADALTDGLLILRYLLGVRGTPLVTGSLGQGFTRGTFQLIEADILSKMP